MNIIFNKCIFAYLCIFYNSTKYFYEFQSIFVNFSITDILVKISTDISVKSNYRYIRVYRYFDPFLLQGAIERSSPAPVLLGSRDSAL